MRTVSVDALLDAGATRKCGAEIVGTAGVTFNQRAAINTDLSCRMPFAGGVSIALGEDGDAAALGLAAVGTPSTFSVVAAFHFLRGVVAVLAVEVAGSGVGVPATHLFELLAADFGVDATASFNAEVVENVPHALGVVGAGNLVGVLELALGLTGFSSFVPVAE